MSYEDNTQDDPQNDPVVVAFMVAMVVIACITVINLVICIRLLTRDQAVTEPGEFTFEIINEMPENKPSYLPPPDTIPMTTLPPLTTPTTTLPPPEPLFYCPEDSALGAIHGFSNNGSSDSTVQDSHPSYWECYIGSGVTFVEDLVADQEYCVVDDELGGLYDFVVIDPRPKLLGDITDEFDPYREADHQIIMVVPEEEIPDVGYVSVGEAGLGPEAPGFNYFNITFEGACH